MTRITTIRWAMARPTVSKGWHPAFLALLTLVWALTGCQGDLLGQGPAIDAGVPPRAVPANDLPAACGNGQLDENEVCDNGWRATVDALCPNGRTALQLTEEQKPWRYLDGGPPPRFVQPCVALPGIQLDARGPLGSGFSLEADLADADLRGADLHGANFFSAHLEGADLRGADLRGANLRFALLSGANLQGANLRGALLDAADFRKADLTNADLRDVAFADFTRAILTGSIPGQGNGVCRRDCGCGAAVYADADGDGVGVGDPLRADEATPGTCPVGATMTGDCDDANPAVQADCAAEPPSPDPLAPDLPLTCGNDGVEADQGEACDMGWRSFFCSGELRRPTEAELEQDDRIRDLSFCTDLSGLDLSGRRLMQANFRGASLTRTNLAGADLRGASFEGADLRSADFRGADLTGANLSWADLRGANLEGAQLEGARLEGSIPRAPQDVSSTCPRDCRCAPRYTDGDGDGVGGAAIPAPGPDQCPAGGVVAGGDCDDADPAAKPGAMEQCGNQKDDDCNGATDEGCECVDGASDACYGGPPETLNVGECKAGTTACDGRCTDQVLPSDEVCDLRDNDCDGEVDNLPAVPCDAEALEPLVGACRAAAHLECRDGQAACVPGQPSREVENGLDDDCDGEVDERDENACDGADNDGDGEIDEADELPAFCTDDQGCFGTPVCQDGALRCEGGGCCVPAGEETCNGADDDCNGTVDDLSEAPCETQLPQAGELCAFGARTCADGADVCVPVFAGVVPEDCGNALDDNCDGQVDEDCGAAVERCDNGQDDDGDEAADCEDPDCAEAFDCLYLDELGEQGLQAYCDWLVGALSAVDPAECPAGSEAPTTTIEACLRTSDVHCRLSDALACGQAQAEAACGPWPGCDAYFECAGNPVGGCDPACGPGEACVAGACVPGCQPVPEVCGNGIDDDCLGGDATCGECQISEVEAVAGLVRGRAVSLTEVEGGGRVSLLWHRVVLAPGTYCVELPAFGTLVVGDQTPEPDGADGGCRIDGPDTTVYREPAAYPRWYRPFQLASAGRLPEAPGPESTQVEVAPGADATYFAFDPEGEQVDYQLTFRPGPCGACGDFQCATDEVLALLPRADVPRDDACFRDCGAALGLVCDQNDLASCDTSSAARLLAPVCGDDLDTSGSRPTGRGNETPATAQPLFDGPVQDGQRVVIDGALCGFDRDFYVANLPDGFIATVRPIDGPPMLVAGRSDPGDPVAALVSAAFWPDLEVWDTISHDPPALTLSSPQSDTYLTVVAPGTDVIAIPNAVFALGGGPSGAWSYRLEVTVTRPCEPAPEICNGADDDCDGTPDNVVGACETGRPGLCAQGTRRCDPVEVGREVCVGPEPANEVCDNGVDDDCDALIDEDCAPPGCAADADCDPGQVCVNGACEAGAFCAAQAEVTTITESGTYPVDTTDRPSGYAGSCGASLGRERAFRIALAGPSTLIVETQNLGAGYDSVIHLRAGPCDGGPELGCNDDFVGLGSRLAFDALPAGDYYLFVDGFNGSVGTSDLVVTIIPTAPECQADADCAAGEICFDGICVARPECLADVDCAAGEVCTNGTCVAAPECVGNQDCAAGEVCTNGTCEPDPMVCPGGCPPGMACMNGVCMPDGGGCGPFGCPPGMDCVNGQCVVGPPPCGGANMCPEPLICVNGVCVDRGVQCVTNDDCPGGVCVDGDCQAGCFDDAGCPAGQTCQAGVCAAPPAGSCGDPIALAPLLGTVITPISAGAGSEEPGAGCLVAQGVATGNEIVYRAQVAGEVTVCLDTFGSEVDTVLHVRSGECRGDELGCNDDTPFNAQSRLQVTLPAGSPVFIVADTANADVSGRYRLNVNLGACP